MDNPGRTAFVEVIEARIAEWDKNISLLGHRLAKKEDADARAKVEVMKSRLPVLAEKVKSAFTVTGDQWSDFKSEVDLIFEDLIWSQNYVMRRMGAS